MLEQTANSRHKKISPHTVDKIILRNQTVSEYRIIRPWWHHKARPLIAIRQCTMRLCHFNRYVHTIHVLCTLFTFCARCSCSVLIETKCKNMQKLVCLLTRSASPNYNCKLSWNFPYSCHRWKVSDIDVSCQKTIDDWSCLSLCAFLAAVPWGRRDNPHCWCFPPSLSLSRISWHQETRNMAQHEIKTAIQNCFNMSKCGPVLWFWGKEL